MKQILLIILISVSWLSLNAQQENSQKEESLLQNPVSLEDKLFKQSKIAFASNRDGNFEIYSMSADGNQPSNLTNNSAWDEYPSWSPDGKKIAFQSNRDGNSEIYIMNADGSQQTRLTDNPAYDAVPSWSPEGNKIAFSSAREGHMAIYVMNTDGSKQTRLTNKHTNDGKPDWAPDVVNDVKPFWSPDGNKIAFQSTRDGKEEVYIMNPDGSNQTNLTNNPVWDGCLSWSPDGKKIAYSSKRDVKGGIYVMNADGSNQTWLTNNHAMCPSWSPDGKWIVFYSLIKDEVEELNFEEKSRFWYEFNMEIYIMNTDGSNQLNLTNNSAYDGYPSWSSFLQIEK